MVPFSGHDVNPRPERLLLQRVATQAVLLLGLRSASEEILRTDNWVPFATQALGRLSQLSVWWVRLGINPELIEPGHPVF